MVDESGGRLDLDAYLARTAYDGAREPAPAVLQALHLAHATRVPFENIDVLLGRPVRLDLDSLQGKLVRGRRGGYCFEHNTLFAAALEAIGFRVTRLAARVRFGAARILPRTHMLLEVEAGGSAWLADVGFGGDGLLHPVPLREGEVVRQFHWTYRVTEAAGLWVLQSLRAGEWHDLYAFTREPQYPVDFEMANHFTSTHPDSIFVRTLTAQSAGPEERHVLRNREWVVDRGGDSRNRTVADDRELGQILSGTFGLDFPPDVVTALFRRSAAPV
jgi:N-hydroxyarylamine O-acetyltransferase